MEPPDTISSTETNTAGTEHCSSPPGCLVDLTTLTRAINVHLRDHQSRTSEECQAVMGSVEANLEGLMDRHFSPQADPARVSEMLLFHLMFSG